MLAQDHPRLELIISDNASTDGTDVLCQRLARADRRIVYFRQPANIGLFNNFLFCIQKASGAFFRWIGDDDWLAPSYVSRCLDALLSDDALILVTTQIEYARPDGTIFTPTCSTEPFRARDPLVRFAELTNCLANTLPVDPLYSLLKRDIVTSISRRNTIREDEVFACKLALAGPWGHLHETLARRSVHPDRLSAIARRLDVPQWQAHLSFEVQCAELLRYIHHLDVASRDKNLLYMLSLRMYLSRHLQLISHRWRRLRFELARA